MGSFSVDKSKWPIVINTVEGTVTDAQLDEWMEDATAVLLRGEKYVAVMDASRIGQVSAYTRKRSREWQRRYREQMRANCLGTAYVLRSPVVRFVAMTVLMVTQLPMPYTVCGTLEEALAWAEQRLVDGGVRAAGSEKTP